MPSKTNNIGNGAESEGNKTTPSNTFTGAMNGLLNSLCGAGKLASAYHIAKMTGDESKAEEILDKKAGAIKALGLNEEAEDFKAKIQEWEQKYGGLDYLELCTIEYNVMSDAESRLADRIFSDFKKFDENDAQATAKPVIEGIRKAEALEKLYSNLSGDWPMDSLSPYKDLGYRIGALLSKTEEMADMIGDMLMGDMLYDDHIAGMEIEKIASDIGGYLWHKDLFAGYDAEDIILTLDSYASIPFNAYGHAYSIDEAELLYNISSSKNAVTSRQYLKELASLLMKDLKGGNNEEAFEVLDAMKMRLMWLNAGVMEGMNGNMLERSYNEIYRKMLGRFKKKRAEDMQYDLDLRKLVR